MDAKQLAEIKARAEKATPGEWKVSEAPQRTNVICGDDRKFLIIARWLDSFDAQFIAHARTDIPALVAEVERLTEEKDSAEKEYRHYLRLSERADQQIATLEKALRMACGKIGGVLVSRGDEWYDYYLKQSQEQEGLSNG